MNLTVTASVSTRNRYHTTLPPALMGLINQTVLPKELVIYDDGEHKDLRQDELYQKIFATMDRKGIAWRVEFGDGKGQVLNHQKAFLSATTDLVWRIDDDNVPEFNVLETLLKHFDDPQVAAAGGLVIDPSSPPIPSTIASNKISDIFLGLNQQWFRGGVVQEVDHLYSSFVYRRSCTDGYCMDLSPAGHREETIFTYEMKRKGYKIIFDPTTTTWHYRSGSGGIRDHTRIQYWQRDEAFFHNRMQQWGITPKNYKVVVLQCGLGDQIAFSNILPELIAKYPNILCFCCNTEVFKDYPIKVGLVPEAAMAGINVDAYNIYRWMIDRKWQGSLTDAFKGMYL